LEGQFKAFEGIEDKEVELVEQLLFSFNLTSYFNVSKELWNGADVRRLPLKVLPNGHKGA